MEQRTGSPSRAVSVGGRKGVPISNKQGHKNNSSFPGEPLGLMSGFHWVITVVQLRLTLCQAEEKDCYSSLKKCIFILICETEMQSGMGHQKRRVRIKKRKWCHMTQHFHCWIYTQRNKSRYLNRYLYTHVHRSITQL